MKSAVMRLEVKPERLEDFKHSWKKLLEGAHKQKGFVSGLLFTEPRSGKCVSIGFWESVEEARAYRQTPEYETFLMETKDAVVEESEPKRDVYDVSGDTTGISEVKKAA